MVENSQLIPEALIEETALKNYQKRQEKGIQGSAETDWQEAINYLERHPGRVWRWKLQERLQAPAVWLDGNLQNLTSFLEHSATIKLLGYAETIVIVVGLFSYFAGAAERQKQSNYQAWQVINSSLGQRHGGGRRDALEALNKNGVSLQGINLENAYIPGVNLREADLFGAFLKRSRLSRANLGGASFWAANLEGASLIGANLEGTYFGMANLEGASLIGANLEGTYFGMANLEGAFLIEANLAGANLAGANLTGVSLAGANIQGITFNNLSEFLSLTAQQLEESCFWDKEIAVFNPQNLGQKTPIAPDVIAKAMQETPYDMEKCTEFWSYQDKRIQRRE